MFRDRGAPLPGSVVAIPGRPLPPPPPEVEYQALAGTGLSGAGTVWFAVHSQGELRLGITLRADQVRAIAAMLLHEADVSEGKHGSDS